MRRKIKGIKKEYSEAILWDADARKLSKLKDFKGVFVSRISDDTLSFYLGSYTFYWFSDTNCKELHLSVTYVHNSVDLQKPVV